MIGQTGPAPTRPSWARTYDLGQLLDKAIRVYRQNFILFVAISAVAAVPDIVLLTVGVSVPTAIFRFISVPYILAAYYVAATHVVFRGPVGPLQIFLKAVRRYRSFAGVLAGYVAAAICLFNAPTGLYLITAFGPTACVLAAESSTPALAFRRWNDLIKKNLGRVALDFLGLFLLGSALAAVVAVLAIVAVDLIPSSHRTLHAFGEALILLLPVCLTAPLAAIGYCLIYVDVRVRVEENDLDDLAKSAADAA